MGLYHRARRLTLAAVCASSMVAGAGMVVAPGAALAVNCKAITGSGSSLQTAQQTEWIAKKGKFAGCLPSEEPAIKYEKTSSGRGLKEFGIEVGGKLTPRENEAKAKVFDAFVGTDDPPTKALLAEGKKASGSKAITIPVVSAPIAIIVHLPVGCEVTSGAVVLSNQVLKELWLGKWSNWQTFLTAAGATSVGCSVEPIKKEVRSDSSGTSFAFKQYLCQIEEAEGTKPCKEWEKFVTDEATWPAATGALTKHKKGGVEEANEGSGGEANAVSEEAGSVGYVNLANAVGTFTAFKTKEKGEKFWARVRNTGAAGEPISGTSGNCPTTLPVALTKAQEEAAKGEGVEGAEGPNWSSVHLANPATTTNYPLCTLTYDVLWEEYTTTKLEEAAFYNKMGTEVKNTTKPYFEYILNALKGQVNIAADYTKLPTAIATIAKADLAKVK